MKHCLDCKKEISKRAKRCKKCANLGKLNHNFNKDAKSKAKAVCSCGTPIVWQTVVYGSGKCRSCSGVGQKREAWNKGVKNSTNTFWLGKSNRDIFIKHHVYGKSNPKTIAMKQGQHMRLHWLGYEYLVEINFHRKYLEEFLIKYDVNTLSNDGKIVHHIDCNRNNDANSNLLFLESRALHTKLHKEAYWYLVKYNLIDGYLKWFFSKERKEPQQIIAHL